MSAWISWILLGAEVLGFVSAIHALLRTRTAQGTIAWIVSLITFPIVAVPAYWVFGRSRFNGYVLVRQRQEQAYDAKLQAVVDRMRPFVHTFDTGTPAVAAARLAKMNYVGRNHVELLIDGAATFDSILAGIAGAEHYVLVQFYIVRDDGLGRRLQQALIERARAGIQIWFLFDEIGSHSLPQTYVRGLEEAGVRVRPFHSTRGARNRFQLNFRNHRKIVIVDERVGWIGGHNVGDEYLGLSTRFGPWRDTHVRIEGPAVLQLQISFVEDWRWAADETLEFPWQPRAAPRGDAVVLVLPSGPADGLDTASLMYQQAIHAAKQRIWIASPYFVPDDAVMSALELAALRGVDVKILLPERADTRLMYYSTFAFVGRLMQSGVEIHRYQPGFLHEKVFLLDDRLCGIGTANLDNRSFRLNFEITALIADAQLTAGVERMFQADLARSIRMTLSDVNDRPWWFRAFTRAAYLTAPVQ